MPSISIPEDAYQTIVAQATARNIAVEEVLRRAVEALPRHAEASGTESSADGHHTDMIEDLPYAGWKQVFDALLARAQSRADRYPPGFRLDDSREAMYEGCGE